MRISITLNGKATTISVDDTLMDYLGAVLVKSSPKLHARAKRQQDMAKSCIRETILQQADVPSKDLSQYVQRMIIHMIAEHGLADIIQSRGPRYKKEPFDIASLFGGDRQAADQAVQNLKSKNKLLDSAE